MKRALLFFFIFLCAALSACAPSPQKGNYQPPLSGAIRILEETSIPAMTEEPEEELTAESFFARLFEMI